MQRKCKQTINCTNVYYALIIIVVMSEHLKGGNHDSLLSVFQEAWPLGLQPLRNSWHSVDWYIWDLRIAVGETEKQIIITGQMLYSCKYLDIKSQGKV